MTDAIRPPKDLPREELMQVARDALQQYPGAVIHFKFTCMHCGERCTFEEPNQLYEDGVCFRCGQSTPVSHGGFMIAMEWKDEGASPRRDKK